MLNVEKSPVSAIVVAAGLSSRMGSPKQLLAYGAHTVIEQIVSVLLECSLEGVVVVTGHQHQAIEAKLGGWPVRTVFNPDYAAGEMLSSVQAGLAAFGPETQAALIVLSDQPQIQAPVVHQLIEAYQAGPNRLIIPSYKMRRGHPILIDRAYWPDILAQGHDKTLRHVINAHAADIHYVLVETDSVLRDIDTPEQYRQVVERFDQA